jgi:hypothetical protein
MTLEQVLSRRRKMLMDMAAGIELELRDSLGEANYPLARKILRKALEFGAYTCTHPSGSITTTTFRR